MVGVMPGLHSFSYLAMLISCGHLHARGAAALALGSNDRADSVSSNTSTISRPLSTTALWTELARSQAWSSGTLQTPLDATTPVTPPTGTSSANLQARLLVFRDRDPGINSRDDLVARGPSADAVTSTEVLTWPVAVESALVITVSGDNRRSLPAQGLAEEAPAERDKTANVTAAKSWVQSALLPFSGPARAERSTSTDDQDLAGPESRTPVNFDAVAFTNGGAAGPFADGAGVPAAETKSTAIRDASVFDDSPPTTRTTPPSFAGLPPRLARSTQSSGASPQLMPLFLPPSPTGPRPAAVPAAPLAVVSGDPKALIVHVPVSELDAASTPLSIAVGLESASLKKQKHSLLAETTPTVVKGSTFTPIQLVSADSLQATAPPNPQPISNPVVIGDLTFVPEARTAAMPQSIQSPSPPRDQRAAPTTTATALGRPPLQDNLPSLVIGGLTVPIAVPEKPSAVLADSFSSPSHVTDSTPVALVGGQTVSRDGPAVVVEGQTVSYAGGSLYVGTIVAPFTPVQIVLDPSPIVVGDVTLLPALSPPSAQGPSAYEVDGLSLSRGGPAVTLDGDAYTVGPSGVVIAAPQSVYTVGGQDFTANPSGFVVGSATLLPGGTAVTVSGTPVSLASGGVVTGSSSNAPVLPTVHIKSYAIDGKTISEGGPGLTVSGTVISVGPSGPTASVSTSATVFDQPISTDTLTKLSLSSQIVTDTTPFMGSTAGGPKATSKRGPGVRFSPGARTLWGCIMGWVAYRASGALVA